MTDEMSESEAPFDGVPTYADQDRADMWRDAKAANADIWTHLSAEQRAMIDRRIAWVDGHYSSSGSEHPRVDPERAP